LVRQEARCEEKLQLKLMSMQLALSSTPLEPAVMKDMQPSVNTISHEPQEGTTKVDEVVPFVEGPLIQDY
jgi:hypothetical protein